MASERTADYYSLLATARATQARVEALEKALAELLDNRVENGVFAWEAAVERAERLLGRKS